VLAVIYLITMTIAGLAVVQHCLPTAPSLVKLAGGLLVGIVFTAWITYAVALGLHSATDESLLIGIFAALAVHGVLIGLLGRGLIASRIRITPFELALVALSLALSFWLMDNRLLVAYDAPGDPLLVSAETWGDTALHTALSRSFAEGANYPTEYPFFANEPIRYHFGYDFFAGALQKGDLSVGLSFNLPGALGFTAMMVLLFSVGRVLFMAPGDDRKPWWRIRSVWIGLIAVAVLITNQSLEWLRWFNPSEPSRRAQYDLSFVDALKPANWWDHSGYLSIGPYYPDKIAIFNTLNVYLTQTHLIIGMAVVLFVAFGLLRPLRRGEPLPRDRMLLLGAMFGLSFWLNGVLFIAAGVFFGSLLVIFAVSGAFRHAQSVEPEIRISQFGAEFWRWAKDIAWFAVPALALALPQAVWLNGGIGTNGSIRGHWGYLVCSSPNAGCHGLDSHGIAEMDLLNLSDWGEFVNYWLLNEGLVFPLLIVAAVIGSRSDRKIMAAVMVVFIAGSSFYLSRDLGGHNHKIFNLWEVLAAPFVGYALVELWNIGRGKLGTLTVGSFAHVVQPAMWLAVPVAGFFLVLSGLLDFMTIKNDFEVSVFGDPPVVAATEWIEDHTPGDAVFLHNYGKLDSGWNIPNLAGRRSYLAYTPWASSAGYDVDSRMPLIARIYAAATKMEACDLLLQEEIDYVLIGPPERSGENFALNEPLYSTEFTRAGDIPPDYSVYDVRASCGP